MSGLDSLEWTVVFALNWFISIFTIRLYQIREDLMKLLKRATFNK